MIPISESQEDQLRGASVPTEHRSKMARKSAKGEPRIGGLLCVDNVRDAVSGVLLAFGGDAGDAAEDPRCGKTVKRGARD